MASTHEDNVHPAQQPVYTQIREIPLRSKSESSKNSEFENRSVLRLGREADHRTSLRQSESALLLRGRTRQKAGGTGEAPRNGHINEPGAGFESQQDDLGANGLAGETSRRHRSASKGRQPKGGNSHRDQGPSTGAETKTSKGGRRRAIIPDYSENEGDRDSHQVSQPLIIKGKVPPCNDNDIDMELADVSPEHGGSSLKLSLSNEDFTAIPNQAALLRIDTINLVDRTPTHASYPSPRKVTTSDNHSAKRRRGELGGLATISDAHKPPSRKTKEPIPSIDIVSRMWLGFSIHEAIAIQSGTEIIHETLTNDEFAKIGTPSREIIEFKTLRRAFPRVPQVCYPHERSDAVPGNHRTRLVCER